MLAIVGAAVVAVIAYLADRTSRFSPARERIKQWYVNRRGGIERAWLPLQDMPAVDEAAVAV